MKEESFIEDLANAKEKVEIEMILEMNYTDWNNNL